MSLGFDSVSQSPLSTLPWALLVRPTRWFELTSGITSSIPLDSATARQLAIDSQADSVLALNSTLRLS